MNQLLKRLIPPNMWETLRTGKNRSSDSFYQLLARRLLSISNDEKSGLTYLFEEQDYTPETVIQGYLLGIFPSSFYGDGKITWHDPDPRGLLPLHDFHISRNLRRILRQERFQFKVNDDFSGVLAGCAEGREKTHVTQQYIALYNLLHEMGIAHSVSAWQDGEMVGGTYGLAFGGYFVSESAFTRVRDSSKAATVRLTEILAASGFLIHDVWWHRTDLEQFGGYTLPRQEFHRLHRQAILTSAKFDPNTPQTLSIGKTQDD